MNLPPPLATATNAPNPLSSTLVVSGFLEQQIRHRRLCDVLGELLSEREIKDIANRIEIIKRLEAGQNQRQIASDLGVGIATVTRGAKIIKDRQKLSSK